MSSICLLLVLFQSSDLLDAVNSERGGRHWIDQKPDPPKSAEEENATFQLEPGSRIELVAAEPLVFDPVWIDFDHRGRMFVAEYSDYPIGPVDGNGKESKDAEPLSRIVLLEDEDGDGRMDKRTVFADKLKFCHSFMPLMGGILAGAQTEIVFLKDTDGDNVADVREVWFDGFTPAHPQMQIGCPRWGLDNKIYLTYAPGNVRCRRPGFETDQPVKMPRQDMRFDPLTMKFETISGLGQFGNTIDNNGHRFFCTNRNPIMMEMIPHEIALQNSFVSIGKRHTDVGPSGGDTKVFPLVAMKSNWLAHAGTHTSACGVTAYRGDLWDADFQRSVFACEPVGHLVTRSIVSPQVDSPALTARRARQNADFLASSDTWFRPASLRTGPNGALYLADMYRMWVEHPKFLPPDIAARIDWRAGEDRGRIWRIVPDEKQEVKTSFEAPQATEDWFPLLGDSNGWRRQMAQQTLVTSDDDSVSEKLKTWLKTPRSGLAAIHGLRTIHGRGDLKPEDIDRFGGRDRDFHRYSRNVLRMELAQGDEQLAGAKMSVQSPSAYVRMKAVLSCLRDGKVSDLEREEILKSALLRDANRPWITDAILLATLDHSVFALNTMRGSVGQLKETPAAHSLLYRLGELTGKTGSPKRVSEALGQANAMSREARWMTSEVLRGLAAGLPRNRNKKDAKTLSAFLADPPEVGRKASLAVRALLDRLTDQALDRKERTEDRVAAITLLPLKGRPEVVSSVKELLVPGESQDIQRATIEIARQNGGEEATSVILSRWNNLAPAVRGDALSLLMSRTASTAALLNEMQSGAIPSSVIDIDQRVRLLQNRDAGIKKLATKIFGGVVSADRKAVADKYEPAITMESSAERGLAVFKKSCSKCHRIDGQGSNVGPDISDTRNRSRDALLYDILDPNRRVDPQFTSYIVVTNDGRTYNGLLVSDTGSQIVLRQAEGKEQTISRDEIDELQATTKSLMPEGVEKDVDLQQMADLLEFLKAR